MFLQCDIINLGFEKTEIAPKTRFNGGCRNLAKSLAFARRLLLEQRRIGED